MNWKKIIFLSRVVGKLVCLENRRSSKLPEWGRKSILLNPRRNRNGEIQAFRKKHAGFDRFGVFIAGLGVEQPGTGIDGPVCGAVFAGEGIFGSSI